MMKKNGFTLAEVLITLAIIGVVATLTLPALMTNTQEQQAKTSFKKGLNTLTEAAQMNSAIAGFDYASITNNSTTDENTQSLFAIMTNRTSMDYKLSGKPDDNHKEAKVVEPSNKDNYVVFFRDGSAMSFNPKATEREAANAGRSKLEVDGLPYGISVLYDTNGAKGPNALSNCSGDVTLNSGSKDKSTDDNCRDKKLRVIKDQFSVRLRAGLAVPNGAASRWAYDN